MKPKTIERRKSWPKWARWYAADHPRIGFRCVFSKRPVKGSYPQWCNTGKRILVVRGPIPDPDWTKTLRKIVPRSRVGKGEGRGK